MRREKDEDEDSVEQKTTFALYKFRKIFRCSTILLNVYLFVRASATNQNKHIQMWTSTRKAFPQRDSFSFHTAIQFPKLSDLRTNINDEQHISELSIRVLDARTHMHASLIQRNARYR